MSVGTSHISVAVTENALRCKLRSIRQESENLRKLFVVECLVFCVDQKLILSVVQYPNKKRRINY